jgi:hypothetical protein
VPSLREIEKAVSTLWLNKEARMWLVKRKGEVPACLRDAPPEILQQVDRKGVELYAELMNFGHQDVMASIYPFCMKLLAKKWEPTVDDYLLKFPPEHYNFNRLCNRLSEYFTTYGGISMERFPFLAELADYEWIELEKLEADVAIETFPHHEFSDPKQISELGPVVNPTLTVREYKYDIMEIASSLEHGDKLGKVAPKPTFVAVYRHPETHLCKFVELGAAAAKVVEAARSPKVYQQLIPVALSSMPNTTPQEATVEFLQLVEDLQEMKLFVGSTNRT